MRTYNIKPIVHFHTISQFSLFYFLFVMAVSPISGQNTPKKLVLQPKDYDLWHTLRPPLISGDGKWTSYLMDYEQKQDTLFVVDIKRDIKYVLPNAHSGQFQPSKSPNLFAFKDKLNGIGVLNLKTGITEWVKETDRFEFSKDGRYLACFSPKKKHGYLKLFDILKNETTVINDIQNFNFDPTENTAVLVTNIAAKSKLELLQLHNMKRTAVLERENSEFMYFIWNESGSAFAFIESTHKSKHRLYYFENGKTPVLSELNGIDLGKLGNSEISKHSLSFSKDGERLFFWTHKPSVGLNEKDKDSIKVQVWKGTDKWIYPRQQIQMGWEFNKVDMLAVWWPKKNKVYQIGTAERPEVILTGDQKFALTYNLLTYEPQNHISPQLDFYITNLETGRTSLFAKKLSNGLSIDPEGRYIAYFKEDNWWIYDIKNSKHTNSTANVATSLTYEYAPYSVNVTPFGSMGWTTTGDFLVYDEFDIWKIKAEGKSPTCLTNGREKRISYRKYKMLNAGFRPLPQTIVNKAENLSESIFLITCDSLYNYGYARLQPNGKIDSFLNETGKISELRKSKFANSYIYLQEKNNEPPILHILEGRKSKILVQSNPHQYKFKIGKTELISYRNNQGQKLNGILHYPDNFEVGKEYPMIVNVYEMVGYKYQTYINPSSYMGNGFNYRNFTAAGYFVLEPDILIQKGNPGISATDCVIQAVNKVLEKNFVDKNTLGIIGHSFGGYETAFIISQTNMFAAAVVGAGIFDLTASYHNINKDTGRPEHWHYENQQWQMGLSFYEGKELYKKNSPVEYAQNIKTPTLIWTGNKDYHVNWHQSEAMYLALRRLNIVVELLVYENEIHSLLEAKNQKDLTDRIINWFDKYLRNESEGNI